jgi:hypothetical protein
MLECAGPAHTLPFACPCFGGSKQAQPNARLSSVTARLVSDAWSASRSASPRTSLSIAVLVVSDEGVSGIATKLGEREQGKRLFDMLHAGDTLVVRFGNGWRRKDF